MVGAFAMTTRPSGRKPPKPAVPPPAVEPPKDGAVALPDRVKTMMLHYGLVRQAAFARRAGVSTAAVSLWLSGKRTSFDQDSLDALRSAFPEIPMLWLTTGEGPGPGDVPINEAERQIPLAAPGSAIRVRGDHMAPSVVNNDLVTIDSRQRDPTSTGGIWAVRIEGQVALARIQMRPGKAYLHFDNPSTPPFEVPLKNLEVLGRVVRLVRET